jgi:hypothetical protein
MTFAAVAVGLTSIDLTKRPYDRGSVHGGLFSVIIIALGIVFNSYNFAQLFIGSHAMSNQMQDFISASDFSERYQLPKILISIDINGSAAINTNFLSLRFRIRDFGSTSTDILLNKCRIEPSVGFYVDGYCNNNTDIYIQSLFGLPNFTYAQIDLGPCYSPSSVYYLDLKPNCSATDEDIQNYLSASINVIEIWTYEKTSWNQDTWVQTIYQNIDSAYWTGLETYFTQKIDIISKRILGTTRQQYAAYQTQSFRFDDVSKYDGRFMSIFLKLSGNRIHSDITRYQLIDWLFQAGSIIGLLGASLKLFGFFISRKNGILKEKCDDRIVLDDDGIAQEYTSNQLIVRSSAVELTGSKKFEESEIPLRNTVSKNKA